MTLNYGLSFLPSRFSRLSFSPHADSPIYNPRTMMPIPHQIPSSAEPNHLALIAFARGSLCINPSLTSYTCHLLLLDPALGPVQQAEAYFMLYSTSSNISWLRAAVALCDSIPAIRNELEGSEGFQEWKRILDRLDKGEGEVKMEHGQDIKTNESVDPRIKMDGDEEEAKIKIEQSEGFANELAENHTSNFTNVKDEDNGRIKVEDRSAKNEVVPLF